MQSTNANALTPPKVLASAACGFLEQIQKHNGDVDRILGNATVRTTDLDNPINEINLNQHCLMFEEAAKITGYDNFGLRFGDQFQPEQLGPIGYAAITSPTLSSALQNMERYFCAHQGKTSFGLIQDSDILWLSYRILDPRIEYRRQDAELSLGMFRNIFRRALGPGWAPLEIRFEHAAPDKPHEHETIFGAPVKFGSRTNAIAFRRKCLDATMPGQDPYLFALIEAFLQSRSQIQTSAEDFACVVRNQIKLHLGDSPPTLCMIAKTLGYAEHAFHKELKESGLNYNDLLRAARKELALHYIINRDIPLTDVAYCLGYSELSAFSRAFRSWTGMSPQRYRRQNQ
ncbi:MAG: AraC family transcriptional regulator [Gammaproteobacteria bacterium]|nr:AraC family transcriptional regulator [Gammaproteobacteria bacterium]